MLLNCYYYFCYLSVCVRNTKSHQLDCYYFFVYFEFVSASCLIYSLL